MAVFCWKSNLFSTKAGNSVTLRKLNLIIMKSNFSEIIKDEKAFFHVGAGVVADSDPDKEYEETLAKAAPMIRVLSGQEGGC